VFCRSLFVCFLFAIVLSVLRLISYYYPLSCSYTRHTRSCDNYQLVHHVQVYLLSNSMCDTCKCVCYVFVFMSSTSFCVSCQCMFHVSRCVCHVTVCISLELPVCSVTYKFGCKVPICVLGNCLCVAYPF
jgi:hypothetical protein